MTDYDEIRKALDWDPRVVEALKALVTFVEGDTWAEYSLTFSARTIDGYTVRFDAPRVVRTPSGEHLVDQTPADGPQDA